MKKALLIVFLMLLLPVVLLAGDKEIAAYVNKYHGIGDNIRMYLHLVSVDYEVKGLGYSIVKDNGKNCIVRYNFSLDGEPKYAEWRYGKGSGIVDPLNEWARIFMGE